MSKIRFLKRRTFNSHDGSTFRGPKGRIGVEVDFERRMGNVLRFLVRLEKPISLASLTERMNRRFNANFTARDIGSCLRRLESEVGAVGQNKDGKWKASPNATAAWEDIEKIQIN